MEAVKPPIPVVISEAVLAIIAGSDTTASTLSAAWYCLFRNPSAMAHLRNEVDSVFPAGDEPLDFSQMTNMPYLNAVM